VLVELQLGALACMQEVGMFSSEKSDPILLIVGLAGTSGRFSLTPCMSTTTPRIYYTQLGKVVGKGKLSRHLSAYTGHHEVPITSLID
jgi:hypothetical protein